MKKIFIILIIVFLFSCSHKNIKKNEVQVKKPTRVYVAPFKYLKSPIEFSNLDIKIEKNMIKYSYNNQLLDLIVRDLAQKFYIKLKNLRKDYRPVSIDDVENVFQVPVNKVSKKDIAERFNVDYIIQGYIIKFVERQGNSFSVKVPAEVHFIIIMKDIRTNKVLWYKQYHEKQESLSSNLLYFYKFFKRKGKWVSVMELTEAAFNKIILELP